MPLPGTRTPIDKYLDDSVAASGSDIWSGPVIPAGETWTVERFGGAALSSAVVTLQFTADGSTWETIRAGIGPGQFQFEIKGAYPGDGTAKFRIVRQEKSGNPQDIIAWIEGHKST